MNYSVQNVVDLIYKDFERHASRIGLKLYKNSLPKDLKAGCVIRATEITFDENQEAIFFILAKFPDVKSGGNYERNDKAINAAAAYIANNYAAGHGSGYRFELRGQSVEGGEDGQSHVVSNRYFFTLNTE